LTCTSPLSIVIQKAAFKSYQITQQEIRDVWNEQVYKWKIEYSLDMHASGWQQEVSENQIQSFRKHPKRLK
jgi:hypothetical protein